MAEQIIEVEADSLEEARKKAESQVPKDLQIVSEEILSDGKPKSIKGTADTVEAAFEEIESKFSSDIEIIGRKQLNAPDKKAIMSEAFDKETAVAQVRRSISSHARIMGIALKEMGKKGFFGRGKKPDLYEIQVFEPASVEINYKTKAKIRVKLREPPELLLQKLENKDYRVLTSLKIIEKSDPRFSQKLYDKGHDLYLTPLEFRNPYGSSGSLDEQQEDLQSTVQETLTFWKKPKLSYSLNLEKKYELEHDEFRLYRIERFRDFSVSEEVLYVVQVGEGLFFSWIHRAR